MDFIVKSMNKNGRTTTDVMQADSYGQLLQRLELQEFTPLNIITIPSFLSPLVPSNSGKISNDEVIELIESIYLVIKSGLPLYQGISDLAEDIDNKRFKNMLLKIAHSINSGNSLSVAFEPYKDVIGIMMLNLIKIGEETGQLETTLKRGAEFLKRTLALKKKAKSALIYPSFAMVVVTGAMLVWIIYVLPQMTSLFNDMDIELPALTIAMMAVSEFLAEYIGYILVGLVIFVIVFKVLHKRNKIIRFKTDGLVLKIPVIKHIVSGFNIAFISEYLRLALVSGVPLFSALETLKGNINNELFQKALTEASDDVAKGHQLSTAFKRTKLFTPFMLRMMSVGESSGTLDSQLDIISNYYYEKVDYYAENIGKFIEPAILIFVGGFMGLIMIGIMGPIYDMIGKMAG